MEALKLDIYTKIGTCLGLWFEVKKNGVKQGSFFYFRVLVPGSQKYFCEYLRENENIFENNLGYCSGE